MFSLVTQVVRGWSEVRSPVWREGAVHRLDEGAGRPLLQAARHTRQQALRLQEGVLPTTRGSGSPRNFSYSQENSLGNQEEPLYRATVYRSRVSRVLPTGGSGEEGGLFVYYRPVGSFAGNTNGSVP